MANKETDTRIVEMQFDSKDFDKNIKASKKNLKDFKEELDFNSALGQMNGALGKMNETLSTMSEDIKNLKDNSKKLKDEFAGIGSIATFFAKKFKKAWESAANSAMSFAKSMTSAQFDAGKKKYDELLKSVKTIKNATGDSEEAVYGVMTRLQEYTDQTSYSFTDMAANIGKFTSVGIPLEKAEKQMEGIANWAARSGGGITEASRAMYNLSQAMGVGALTKIDWKSIENASMATKEYKNQLIQAGLATGNLVKKNGKVFTAAKFGKQVEVTYQNLAETLSKKWADTEVMQRSFMAYYYEDLYYTGEIASAIKTTRETRDDIRSILSSQTKDAKLSWDDWQNLEVYSEELGHNIKVDSKEARQMLIDIAVEQKKLIKEVNKEGYITYKTVKKNGKQIEITTENIKEFFDLGLFDESMATISFGLDDDALVDMTEDVKNKFRDALGDDDLILKKDWVEGMADAGLATDEIKKAAMEAGVAAGTLEKTIDKDGRVIYKTAKSLGKQMEVTAESFEDSLKMKWFNGEVANKVAGLDKLGKAAYESAQRCTTFKDVIEAWKDMLSTKWMKSFELIFGKLSDAMNLFSGLCNKVGDQLAKFADMRNGILDEWNAAGGRDSLWGALIGEIESVDGDAVFDNAYGLLDALKEVSDLLYEAFYNFVGRFINPENLDKYKNDPDYMFTYLGVGLANFTEKIKKFVQTIRDFFTGVPEGATESRFWQIEMIVESIFAAISFVWQILKGVVNFARSLIGQLQPAIDAVLGLISYFAMLFTGDVENATKKNTIGTFFKNLAEMLKPVTAIINVVVVSIANFIARIISFAHQSGIFQFISNAITLAVSFIAKKIGEFLQSGILQTIFGWIATAITKIPTLVQKIKDLISTFISTAKGNEKVQGFVSTIKNTFSSKNLNTILTNIKNWVKKLGGKISAFISNPEGISGFFNKILNGIFGLFGMGAKAEGSENATDKIAEGIAQPITELANGGAIGEAVGKVIDQAKPGILARITGKIKEIWKTISDFFGEIGNSEAIQNVKNFFGKIDFKELMVQAKDWMKWISIFSVGHGIGRLGGGLKSIGKGFKFFGKNLDKLNLSNMFNIFSGNSSSSVDNSRHFDFSNIGPQLLEIAASVGILVLAAKEIIAMKPEDMQKAGLSLAALIGGLLGAAILAKNFGGNGGALLGIAAAVWLIIKPMQTLSKIPWLSTDKENGLLEMVGKLTLVMLAIALCAKIAKKANLKGLIGMAIAITLLMIPLKILAKMPGFIKDGKFDAESPLFQSIIALSALMLAMGWAIKLTKKCDTKGFAALTFALTVLVGIGALLGRHMDWKQILLGFGPIIALMGMMTLLFQQASKLKAKQIEGIKSVFIAFAAVVTIIIGGIVAMSLLEVKESLIIEVFAGIVLILAAMAVMIHQAGDVKEKKLKLVGVILGILAGMVIVMSGSLIALSMLNVDWKLVAAFFLGMSVVLFAMGSVIKRAANIDEKQLNKLALVFGLLAVPIVAMGASLAAISYYKVSEGVILSFFGGMSVVLLAIGSMIKKAANVNEKQIGKLSLLFGMMSVPILAMGASLAAIAYYSVPETVILSFFGGMTVVLLAMGSVIKKAAAINGQQLGKLSLLFGLLSLPIIAMGAALSIIAYCKVSENIIIEFFAGTTIVLLALKSVIKKAAKLDQKQLGKAALLMGIMAIPIMAIAGALALMASTNVSSGLALTFAATLAAVALVVVALGHAMPKLQNMNPKGIIIAVAAIAAGLIAIFGAVALMVPIVLGAIGNSLEKLASKLLIMSGLLKEFFDRMSTIDEESMKHAMAVFDKLKDIILKFSDFGDYTSGIDAVETQLLKLSTAIGLFYVYEGSIPDPENSKSFKTLSKFIEIAPSLQTISFGNIANEIFSLGVSLGLYDYATKDISTGDDAKGTNLIGTIMTACDGNEGKIGGLPTAIYRLGGALSSFDEKTNKMASTDSPALGFLQALFGQADNIEKMVGLPLDDLGGKLSTLGGGISLYAKGAQEMTGIHLDEAGNAVDENGDPLNMEGVIALLRGLSDAFTDDKLVADMTTASNHLNDIATKTDLGVFAANLESIGNALATFANASNSMKSENADKALSLIALLGQMGGYLTPENLGTVNAFKDAGIEGDGTGNTKLSNFSLDIELLGQALATFAGLTTNTVFDNGFGALTYFSELNTKLSKENLDFTSAFTRTNLSGNGSTGSSTPLGIFALDIGKLATSISQFADLTGNKTFDHGFGAMDKFEELNGKLTEQNLEFLSFFVDNDLSGQGENSPMGLFAKDVGELGTAMGAFAKALVGEDGKPLSFDNAITALNNIAGIRGRLPNIGGIHGFIHGNRETLDALGGDIEVLGQSLNDFGTRLTASLGDKTFDVDLVLGVLTVLETMVNILNKIQITDPNTGDWVSVADKIESVGDFLQVMNQATGPFRTTTLTDQLIQFARDLTSAFNTADGISDEAIAFFNDITSILQNIINVDPAVDFTKTGYAISDGLQQGIRNGQSLVVQAVVDVVTAAIDAGNDTAGVHSPSKVFAEMGGFMDAGLAKGLYGEQDKVEGASKDMVGSAIEQAGLMMGAISAALADDVDFQPTIAPVLDLTNLTAAGSTIDSIFDGYALNLANALGRANAAAGPSGPTEVVIQNPTDLDGILGSISQLQTEITGLNTAISNIKIVLNTGVVAGGITDDIDLNLGRKILYDSRRN